MTRMPRDPQPLEPCGPEDQPHGFIWNNAEHRILEICNTWVIHTLWWEPSQTVWREYFKCVADTGMLCVIFRDLLGGRLVLAADLRLTMDREFWLLLAGAGIAMVSSTGATLLQHYLALRADRIKRERDATERQRTVLREVLLRVTEPAQQVQIAALPDEHPEKLADLAVKHIRKQGKVTGAPAGEKQE